MPVSFVGPGSDQVQQASIDPTQLVQLAAAIHGQKTAEAQQQKENALQTIKLATENPDLLAMMDPNDLKKKFEQGLGVKLASPDQVNANLQQQGVGSSAPVSGNNIEQLGKTVGGSSSGAQAASPASDKSGAKSPGGGVTPGGIVTPGTGALEKLRDGAVDNFTKQIGALAPVYMGAGSQRQQQFMVAKKQQEIIQDYETAQSGGPGAVAATGRLYLASGKEFNAADGTAVLEGSKDPTVWKQAQDFFLHNESGEHRAERADTTLKTLSSDKDFMGQLKSPGDLPRVVDSIVQGHGVPSGVLRDGFSLSQLGEIRDYSKQLVDQGFDPTTANNSAEAKMLGVPYTASLPTAMHGLTIPQQEASAKTATAGADQVKAAAEFQTAKDNHSKIVSELDDPKYKDLSATIDSLANAAHYGVKLPPTVVQGAMDAVANLPNIGLTPKDVNGWWTWLTGTPVHTYEGQSQLPSAEKQQQQAPTGKGTIGSNKTFTEEIEPTVEKFSPMLGRELQKLNRR